MGINSIEYVFLERRRKVFYAFLLLANVAGPIGVLFALQQGRPGFFGLTAVLTAGVLIADVLVLVARATPSRSVTPLDYGRPGRVSRLAGDVRLPIAMLCVSVFVLTVVGRGGLWNLSMAGFFGLLLARSYVTDYERESLGLDLALLMVGAGLLIASQTLTVAYYAVTRDTIYHSAVATRIANYGLGAVEGTRYDDLQAFHVLVATGLGMANVSGRVFAAVLFVVVFPVTVPLALTVTRELGFSSTLGLLAGISIAVNPEFISWGSQAHPQSLSFVFLGVFLLLLAERTSRRRALLLSLPLTAVWVMTHHLSLFMAIVLTAVPLGTATARRVAARVRGAGADSDAAGLGGPLFQYAILVAVTVVYWERSGVLVGGRQWLLEYSPAASEGVETTASLIVSYDDPVTVVTQSIPTLLSDFHYAVWIGFAALGIWAVFTSTRLSTRRIPVVLASILAASLLYFPNPTWIPLRGVAFLARWGIMTLPFVAVAVVLGLDQVRETVVSRTATVLPVVLVVLLLTVSVSSGFSDPSPSDLAGFEKGERKYLSSADMAAFSHTMTYSDREENVRSGGILNNYFILQDWIRRPDSTRRAGPWVDRYNRIDVVDGEIVDDDGLTVFQREAFEEKGIKVNIVNPEGEAYEGLGDVTIRSVVTDEEVAWDGDSRSIVYANDETVIAYNGTEG